MREQPSDHESRIASLFALCLSRTPSHEEQQTLNSLLIDFRSSLTSDPAQVGRLIDERPGSTASAPLDKTADDPPTATTGTGDLLPDEQRIELAATIALARVVLNLDEFMTRE